MTDEIAGLFEDLNKEKLRVVRPSKPIFLCGGIIPVPKINRPPSLRDYIYRNFKTTSPIEGEIILAEQANQLYRDSKYRDLITFEEDIAHIASIILVIAESPGSLAELGAFASNDIIRKKLRIILKEEHANEESFVRYGPVERIKRDSDDYVGIYPWRTNKRGRLILESARPHKREMLKFIIDQLSAVPKSELFSNLGAAEKFFLVYWIIFVCYAISHQQLYRIIKKVKPELEEREIRNVLFCLRLVGWINTCSYSSKIYFYTAYDHDPFDYAYNEGVAITDSARRKAAIARSVHKGAALPVHIRKVVADSRVSK